MRSRKERGQGLVEFTLAVPIIILVLVSVAEIGLALGNNHTIGYGSREGARVGSALANGNAVDCREPDPAGVDKTLVAAVQRILKSPGSGIDVSRVKQIRIFRERRQDLFRIETARNDRRHRIVSGGVDHRHKLDFNVREVR